MSENIEFFTGTYAVKRDAKFRICVPKPLREAFMQKAGGDEVYVATFAQNPNRLLVVPLRKCKEFLNEDELRQFSPFIRDFSLDGQGRYSTTADQRAFLELDDSSRNVVVTGNYDFLSIYNKAVWDANYDKFITRPLGHGQSPKGPEPGDV